jgi:hypothetical protein
MSPTRATTTSRAVPTVAIALASAALALSLLAPTQARATPDTGVTFVYSDEALPGEGRPPSPGPTDPDGAW